MDNLKEINCKEIFKKAYENRYTWKNDFPGYQGKCIFLTNNNIHKGDFVSVSYTHLTLPTNREV